MILTIALFDREPIQVDLKFPALNGPLRSDTVADFSGAFPKSNIDFCQYFCFYSIPAGIVFYEAR